MCKIRWILGKNCFNFCLRTFFTGKGDWKPPEGWNATDPQYHETFDSGSCFQNEDILTSKMPWVTTSLNIRNNFEQINSLLDKVLSRNQRQIRVHESHLIFKGPMQLNFN